MVLLSGYLSYGSQFFPGLKKAEFFSADDDESEIVY